ncbi:hypothetical protein L1887_51759 [Cichorium endivia]|nr:hypothetical protein L1887_51759 [Cichorium endivia]
MFLVQTCREVAARCSPAWATEWLAADTRWHEAGMKGEQVYPTRAACPSTFAQRSAKPAFPRGHGVGVTVVDLAGNLESESEPDPQRHAPSPPDQGDRASSLLDACPLQRLRRQHAQPALARRPHTVPAGPWPRLQRSPAPPGAAWPKDQQAWAGRPGK